MPENKILSSRSESVFERAFLDGEKSAGAKGRAARNEVDGGLVEELAAAEAEGDVVGITVWEGDGGLVVASAGTEVDGARAFTVSEIELFDAADWPRAIHVFDKGNGDVGGKGLALGGGTGGSALDLEAVVLVVARGIEACKYGAGTVCAPSGGLAIRVGDGGTGGDGPIHLVAGIEALVGSAAGALDLEATDGEVLQGDGADGTRSEVVSGDCYDDLAGHGTVVGAGTPNAEIDGRVLG